MRTHLLNDKLICTDETTARVLREQDRNVQSKSYIRIYRSGESVEQLIVIYDYQPSCAGQYVKNVLGNLLWLSTN